MKRKGKEKYPLLFATIVAFLTVCTTGVSTFAWFQATAAASIKTTSSNTTITVSKPEDYTFYYYNKNGTANYASPVNFATDFSEVSSSDLTEGVTLWTGMCPGQSMVFAMKIENLNTSSDDVTLNISKIISNDTTKESNSKNKRFVRGGDVQINIGWAIDIYALSSSSSEAYTTNSFDSSKSFLTTSNTNNAEPLRAGIIEDKFNYSYSNYSELDDGSHAEQLITTSIDLFDNERAVASTMYYFFRVYYSNDASTLYKEVDSVGTALMEPADQSKGHRYFEADPSTGTSNCYGGLTFTLNTMSLTW